MQSPQTNPFTRSDTLFGVCEALGEDFGIPALLLRIAFAALLFWNPVAALATYFATGLLIALTRWIHPNPRSAEPAVELAEAPVQPEATAEPEPVPLAA